MRRPAESVGLVECIRADLYRTCGDIGIWSFLRQLVLGESFELVFLFRLGSAFRNQAVFRYSIYPLIWLRYRCLKFKLGISLPIGTKVGPGLLIGHFGGIAINGAARIGRNCNISQGATIGQTNRGKKKGVPTIGDNVYIGPGAKVIGNISIGNCAVIGANAVVTFDVAPSAVVASPIGVVVSFAGSDGYVNRIDY